MTAAIDLDLAEVLELAEDLVLAGKASNKAIAAVVDEYANLILADQLDGAPIRYGDLLDSLGIAVTNPMTMRIGAVVPGAAGWRAHFIENGTAQHGPQPFIRPPGDRHAPAFARAVLDTATLP